MAKEKKEKITITDEDGNEEVITISSKHLEVVNEYFINGRNKTRAYMKVYGYKDDKEDDERAKSYASARTLAAQLFANVDIQKYIAFRIRQTILSADQVLASYSEIAEATLAHFGEPTESGFFEIDLNKPEAIANMHLLTEIETERTRRVQGRGEDAEEWEDEHVKIKIVPRKHGLDPLAKYHRLVVDRVEHSGHIVNINYDDCTTEQLARLKAGVDPAIIEAEIRERKAQEKSQKKEE